MPEYTVLQGTHARRDGSVAEPGDTVELTEKQYHQHGHYRYELVEDDASDDADQASPSASDEPDGASDSEVESAVEEAAEGDGDEPTALDDEAASEIPDDWDLLRSMAVVYEGDEVNGSTSQADIEAFFESLSNDELIALRVAGEDRLD